MATTATTRVAGTRGARWRSNSMAARLSSPVRAGASAASDTCFSTNQSLVKKLPDVPSMPRRCGTWPRMVTRTRPSMNPRITGVGMKAATQPMRSAPRSRKKTPIKIASVDVSVVKSAVPCAAMAPTVRADDEQARGAEERVDDQGRDDGVETGDGRHADDAGIGHPLRHHDRPDGEAGEDVREQPPPPIGRKPTQGRHQPRCERGRGGTGNQTR